MATSESFPTDWAHQFYGPTSVDPTAISTGPNQTNPVHNIEGRVGKPGRRRSRASRRAPTTLLNTDPTNFRAMVQQFTGAPPGPYQNRTGPIINFGYGSNLGQAPVGVLGQYQQQVQQSYMDHGGIFPQGAIGNTGFVQGFNYDATDGGVFLDEMGSQVSMRGAPANERNDGYFFVK